MGRFCTVFTKRIILGFEGETNMPKLNFSENLRNTITDNILKLPVIPAEAFSIIQDGVQDGRQNVNTLKILRQKVSQRFSILLEIL